jgi:hypothetical protein
LMKFHFFFYVSCCMYLIYEIFAHIKFTIKSFSSRRFMFLYLTFQCMDPFLLNFLYTIWGIDGSPFLSFFPLISFWYANVPAPCVEKAICFPLNYLGSITKNQLNIWVNYFWLLICFMYIWHIVIHPYIITVLSSLSKFSSKFCTWMLCTPTLFFKMFQLFLICIVVKI